LRNCVESVLDRDNECSDFSEDETKSEVSSIGNDDKSSDKDSDENDYALGPLNVFELQRRKNRLTGSGPKLTTILPTHCIYTDENNFFVRINLLTSVGIMAVRK
jgi:hypothetical protein